MQKTVKIFSNARVWELKKDYLFSIGNFSFKGQYPGEHFMSCFYKNVLYIFSRALIVVPTVTLAYVVRGVEVSRLVINWPCHIEATY